MKNNWEVKSHSYQIADTGDYDGYWEVVNGKGQSFVTREDYDDIEKDLQKIADTLNGFEGNLSFETALELNLHTENSYYKMALDYIKRCCLATGEPMDMVIKDIFDCATNALEAFNKKNSTT